MLAHEIKGSGSIQVSKSRHLHFSRQKPNHHPSPNDAFGGWGRKMHQFISASLHQLSFCLMCNAYPLSNALEGGIPLALKLFQCIIAVLCVAFFLCLVPNFIVCLVSSFRYNGLATLALAGPSGPRAGPSGPREGPSGPLRALRAGSGPYGPAMH